MFRTCFLWLGLALALGGTARAQDCSTAVTAFIRSTVPSAAPATSTALASARLRKLDSIATAIESNREAFAAILSRFENQKGAAYEIGQVIKTLRQAKIHEAFALNSMRELENVAVYGSTNIPLYTLALHAVIPASVSRNIWFRTPQSTREVYQALFAKLREVAPDFEWDRIHLLTEPADVQYDNFRKMYVLGLNRKGKRFERAPSEVVIFTGSPDTGREVQQQIREKLTEMVRAEGKEVPEFRQIFLKFGSGFNPVVITHEAQNILDRPLAAALDAICINSSQDCIAPKFYMVHRNVSTDYLDRLRSSIAKLKFGSNTDKAADYGPLTFKEDLTELKAFRDKYKAYLTNPEANLDPVSRRVDPHVFVFPASMFNQVELKDHYAPFLVHFVYDGNTQLQMIASDPRVRTRAMYASVFGPGGSTETWATRQIFDETNHTSAVNVSIFQEESGNFAFGGFSSDASSVTVFQNQAGRGFSDFEQSRPLLFSKEAARFFPARAARRTGLVAERAADPRDIQHLRTLVQGAQAPPEALKGLKNPRTQLGPRGLKHLRAIGNSEGWYEVFFRSRPPNSEREERLFHGFKVVYSDDPMPVQGKGVAIHATPIGRDVETLNRYRGTANPHLGYGYLLWKINGKADEVRVANAVWPGLMPESRTYRELTERGAFGKGFETARKRSLELVNAYMTNPTEANRLKLRQQMRGLVRGLLNQVQRNYPQGAFIKNFGESTTGDLGNYITSFNTNADNLVLEFENRLVHVARGGAKSFGTSQAKQGMTAEFYETGSKLLTKLLTDPDDILVQERVAISKTDMGFNREIRVDFLEGEAVTARPRYSHEYLAEDQEEAMRVINEFFAKAPPELRYMAGGADLVRLEDGTWKVIEFNFGMNSGSIVPWVFPIESNLFRSALMGRKTPLIQELDAAAAKSIEEQIAYVKGYKLVREKWQKFSIDEMSQNEVLKYLRNKALDEFRESPTPEVGQRVLGKLEKLLGAFESSENQVPRQLLQGARHYVQNRVYGV